MDEIKADALWLSQQVNLDELEALRLTVLEWQYRPESRLRECYSEAELASVKDALGPDNVDKLLEGGQSALHRDEGAFDTQSSRRSRLLRRFMQAKVTLLRFKRDLMDAGLVPESADVLPPQMRSLAGGLTSEVERPLAEDVEAGVNTIQEQLNFLRNGVSWEVEEQQRASLNDMADTTGLQNLGTTLEIILLRVRRSKTTASSDTLLLWLRLMSSVQFFSILNSQIDAQQAEIQRIQSMGSLVTAALFDLASTITSLNEGASSGQPTHPHREGEYFWDADSILDIHELLASQAEAGNVQAGPATLAWALVVHQIRLIAASIKGNRDSHQVQKALDGVSAFDSAAGPRTSASSTASTQQSIFEDLYEKLTVGHSNEDSSGALLELVMDQCHVLDYIASLSGQAGDPSTVLCAYKLQSLQELIAVSHSFLGYTPDLVSAQLAMLAENSGDASRKRLYDSAIEFVEDKFLLEGIYDVSSARFPYECLPFLRLSKYLANANIFDEQGTHYVEFRLRKLTTFTQAGVKGVVWRLIREDESGSFVALDNQVNMLDLTQNKLLTYIHQGAESTSIISADTTGEVISDPDSSPKIIKWQHEYSGLTYIGQLLELHYMGLLSSCLSPFEDANAVVSEIIGLLATLLSTIMQHTPASSNDEQAQHHCSGILDETSRQLNPEADVVSYIFEILEQEIQGFRRRSVSSYDCRILLSCLDFIIVLVKVRPHLIWSNLNRSSLFGRQSSATFVLGFVSAVEVPQRSFDFLEKCAKLYQVLVRLALVNVDDDLVHSRPSLGTKGSVLPAVKRLQSSILLTATEVMFNAFQELSEWSFESLEQQVRLNTILTDSFFDILRFAFDIGESIGSYTAVTATYSESAKFIVSSYGTAGVDDVAVNPLVRILFKAGSRGDVASPGEGQYDRQVASTMSLATLLVRYVRLQELSLTPTELGMFNILPSLVRILEAQKSVRIECLKLIRSIMVFVDQHQPSSLLGHLGSASCIDLLHIIRHIDQESQSEEERAELWKFLALLVRSSQQWLAMVLLTGAAPDSSRKAAPEGTPSKCLRGKNFMQIAIDELGNVQNLPQPVAISMLEFVLEAQQNWPWVANDLESSRAFFSKIISFVAQNPPDRSSDINLAYHNSIAATVTDLSSNHLHYAKIARDIQSIKTFVPLVNWLTSNAVEVSSYNASLHANLRKNFSAKYGVLSVADIKRTGTIERKYGPDFFYDLDYAGKLFFNDSYWHGGKGKSGSQSFSAEFRRANTNLSLVDSELNLLLSLRRLCIDHCRFFVQDREVQKAMAHLVHNCLQANSQVYPAEVIFDSLFQTRADLSAALLHELVAIGARGSEFVGLLEPAWEAVRFRNGSYEQAIINDDLTYWRSTLSTLLMTIQFRINKKRKPTPIPGTTTALVTLDPSSATFLEITTQIVGEGFKSAVSALQDQKQNKLRTNVDDENNLIGPRDISLLVTIMQAILRLPTLSQYAVDLSARINSSSIISSCLLLYSWSHLLTGPAFDNQPRYADFCVQLLGSLSSLPPVAEELAIEGVLSRILTAKTTESLQRVPNGASHVDPRPGCGFLYRVWAAGVLPLCLNLLHGIGGTIAGEVSSFLSQFPNQLIRASTSFMLTPQTRAEGTDALTLTVASEAATLALISFILSSYREAGASAAVDPNTVLPLAGYDEHRKAISEDIRDTLALKDELRRKMTVTTTEKEVSWQKSKDGDKLDAKIVRELKMALSALGRDEDEDDK